MDKVELFEDELIVCENLDRFSQKMPWELACYQFDESNVYEVEAQKICSGCGQEIEEEDEFIESEIWEDEYMHDKASCINKYYRKEKRPEQARTGL